ncbi:MAG: hypothetical protein BACD_01993 [Bacteroides rodentium]
MPSLGGFLDPFSLFPSPHGIIYYAQCKQLSDIYMSQIGAAGAVVPPPVFLLPAGVIGEAVDELVQLARDLYTGIRWIIILKVALILPGSLPTAVADNALFGLLKGPCVHGVG